MAAITHVLGKHNGPVSSKGRNSMTVVNIALSEIEGLMSVSSKGVT